MIVDVPNLGRFRLPEGLSESDVRLLLRGLYREAGVEYPDVRTYGEKFQAGLSRGAQQLLVSATNDLPALGLAALADAGFGGYQDKARQFLEEGAAKYAQIEADYPTAHPDILQAKGPGDVLGFAVENIGQGLPSILSMIGTGGVGGLAARKLAMRSANQMIEEQLKRGVAADALKRMGEKEIARRTMLGAGIGAGGTSFAQAAPEAFRTIYEETGQLAPEEAIIAGGINAMLDSLVPAKVLGELGLFGRMKLTEQVAKKSGFLPTAARVGAEAIKTAGIEGLTEATQTFVNNVAVKFIDSNFDVFSPENVRKYVNSFAAGVSAGSVPGAVGATFKEFGRPAPPATPPEVPPAAQPAPTVPLLPAPQAPVPPVQPPGQPPVQPTPVPPVPPVPPVQPPVQPTPVPPVQPVPPIQPTPVPPVQPVQPVPPVLPPPPVQPPAPGQPALPAPAPLTAPGAPPAPSGEPPQLPAPAAPPTAPPAAPPTAPPMSYQDFLAAQQRRIIPEGRKVQLLQGQKPKRQLPANLQPRNRDAVASISQMQNIANSPDARRLAESRTFTDGAPMVIAPSDDWDTTFAGGKEDVAISDNIEVPFRYAFISASSSMVAPSHDADGSINKKYQSTPFVPITNGRIAGLQQSYRNIAQGKQGALKYKEDILKIGEQLGLKRPTYVDPILVRVVRPKDVPADVGDISNRSQALELSPAEIAKQDANRIADVVETFEFDSKGNPSDETINKFVSRMPKNEANQLIQKTGRGIEPTQLAEQRIKRAVFAAAYNDNTLIEMLSNAPPSAKEDALNVQNAMMRAASAMVKLRGTGDYDIRKFVVEAAKDAINAKRANIKISEYAKIPVIEERPPIQQVLLEFFGNNIRRGNYMATELIDTANTLLEEHENTAPDMFGESTQRPPLLVVQQIGQKEEEGKLFNRVNVQEETGAGSAPRKRRRSVLGFYSALAEGIAAVNINLAQAAGWKDAIKGLINKGKVKADEVEWSGVNDWLDLQQGKVTKAQVEEYLEQGGVQVEETVLGAARQKPTTAQERAIRDWARGQGEDLETVDNGITALRAGDPLGVRDLSQLGVPESLLAPFRNEADALTKYANYQLPGGENYREVLLRLPERPEQQRLRDLQLATARGDATLEQRMERADLEDQGVRDTAYRGTHWEQANVLAHLRVNDRIDADGKKVLFVEEIQSDWGQQGREKGFERRGPYTYQWFNTAGNLTSKEFDSRSELEAYAEQVRQQPDFYYGYAINPDPGIPVAPFVTKTEGWLNLALKRIMIMAAEGGYDRVAFINGEQSAERYDLSKQIESITAQAKWSDGDSAPSKWYIEARRRGDRSIVINQPYTAEQLPDVIGKELAEKIVNEVTIEEPLKRYSGLDLKVGGEGMKAFYDQIVPTALKKLLPKVGGGQMQTVVMERGALDSGPEEWKSFWDWMGINHPEVSLHNAARAWLMGINNNAFVQEFSKTIPLLKQPGFDVTDAMREKVAEGLPMFSRYRNASEAITKKISDIINATDPITKPPPESVPDMFKKYREELDRMGLSDVRLEMFNPDFTDKYLSIGEYTEQWGEKLNIIRIIRIALTTDEARKKYPQYFNKQRLSRTLHHEAVHAMRSMELFTEQEWKALSTASKNDWIKRIWDVGDKPIEELYKDRSYEMIIEEGVARAFEHYTQGRFRPAGIIATIFNKIRNFFEEVVGFAKKHNFTKEQADIFERMLSGEIGRRPRVQTVGPEKLDKILYNAATVDIKKEAMNNLVNSGPPLSSIKDKAKDLVTDLAADKAEYILGAFNLRQLGELAEKDLPQINTYYKTVGEMTGFRDGRITKAADIAQDWIAWAQKNPKLNHDLATCMHGSTLSGLDFNTQFTKIKNPEYQQAWLRVAADPKAVEIYKNVQKYYDESFDMLKAALIERIEKDVEAGKTRTAKLIAIEDAFTKARDGGPYFPLVRFGDYWVSVKQQGQKEKFYMFESRSEHRKFIDKLSQSGLKEGTDFKAGLKAREMLQSGVPLTGFIRTVMDSVDSLTKDGAVTDTEKLKDSVWQAYLALQPDLSTRKQFIHRKNIEGYSNDAIRAFAETTFHGAYHLARVKYGGELDRILLDANRSVRQSPGIANARYLDELKKRHDWVNAPNDINNFSSWASSAAFLYFLTAPASALVNIAQTPMVAYPYLGARYGFTEAFGAFASATKDYWASGFNKKDFYNIIRTLEKRTKDKQLSDKARKTAEQEMLAMQRLYEDGTLNRTQTLSLAGIAERPQDILVGGLGSAMKTAGLKFQDKMTYALGYGFNQAEVFNRQTTALAAYRLARKNKKSHDEAIEEARKVVNETHFEYMNATKPRFMQGPTARIIFQFKNYAQQMTMLYVRSVQHAFAGESKEVKREARRRLTAMLFMTGVFAGYEGLPLYWVIEGTMNALFDDEDEPYDFNNSAKNTLADMFGSNVALALSKGVVSELTGADIASRVSQNGMWFRDSAKSVDEVEAFKQFVVDLAGPFVGIGVNIADGIKKINDGYTWRGIEAMLPPVLKDFLKVGRMSQEGATTLRGDPIVEEVSTWGLFLQALGFTPVDVARGYEVMAEIKGMDRDLDQRRKQLLQQITLAQINGDYQAYNEISDKIITFNSKNPNNPITTESIKRSLAQRVKDTDRALRGIIVNPKREYLLEEARYTD